MRNILGKNNNQSKGVTIQLPNLLIIPLLSAVYSIMHICGGITWNWAVTIVIAPLLTYLGWAFGFLFLTLFCILSAKVIQDIRES